MRIFPTIRRVIAAAASGGGSFIASQVKPAIELRTILRFTGSTVNPAIHTEQSPTTFRGPTIAPAIATTLNGTSGTAAQVATNPAIATSPSPSSALVTEQDKPAIEVVQIKYDLTRCVGAATATEYAVNTRTDFDDATVGNTTGVHNATLCQCSANALGDRSGGLRFQYADHVNKTDLTITSVKLYFYTNQPAATSGGTKRHQWRIGTGAWTVLATYTSSLTVGNNFLTTPAEYDVTASITSWADLDALEASVEAVVPAPLGSLVTVDAVELEIIATATQTV